MLTSTYKITLLIIMSLIYADYQTSDNYVELDIRDLNQKSLKRTYLVLYCK